MTSPVATSPNAAPRRSSRPFISPVPQRESSGKPLLQVVPTPAPARGFFATIIACVLIGLAAFAAVFALNTKMVDTAFEIREQRVILNSLLTTRAGLEDQLAGASTAQVLQDRAAEMGMVPAVNLIHLDLATGTLHGAPGDEG